MAVLQQLPEQEIIDGFKGVIDFYLWNGIPCARKWPTYRPRIPSPQEQASRDAFAYANSQWTLLSPEVKAQWNQMAGGTGLTGKDLSVRAYMQGTNT